MIAYVDTSALLRVVLREAGAIDDLRTYAGLVSSELIAVESARTIDRLRSQGALTMDEAGADRTRQRAARSGRPGAAASARVEPGQRTDADAPSARSTPFTSPLRCCGVIASDRCRSS